MSDRKETEIKYDVVKVRAHLAEQDRLIAIDEDVLDELRTLVDHRERQLNRIKNQRDAMAALISEKSLVSE
jgi:arsenate reductase-like glutaredoxin family protein